MNQITSGAFAARMQQLMYTLVKNYQQCDQMCLSQHGITASQGYALLAFPQASEITMNELSEAMELANSTMTRMVDQLVSKDLVYRRQDDRDRRVVLVGLTPQGQGLRSTLERAKQELFQEVLGEISQEERPAILHALEHVVKLLGSAVENACCGRQ